MTVPPPPFGVHTREKEEEEDDDDDDDVTVVFLESRCESKLDFKIMKKKLIGESYI